MQSLVKYQQVSVVSTERTTIIIPLADAVCGDSALLRAWLDGKAEKTIRAYLRDIARLYTYLQGKPLLELTLEDVQGFKNSLGDLAPASQARTVAAVKSLLSFGAKIQIFTFNVGAVVKLPKIEDTLAERITSEANIAKLKALEEHPRNHAILSLLYHTGIRAEELCNLKWRNLQERTSSGQITVFGKGGKSRAILLDDPDIWTEVSNLRKEGDTDEDYVFQSRQIRSRSGKANRRLDESSIHRIVKAAARRAKVAVYFQPDGSVQSRVSPHWMRHAHATHAIENGAPLPLVQKTLGHKSLATTGKYTHVRPEESSGKYLKV